MGQINYRASGILKQKTITIGHVSMELLRSVHDILPFLYGIGSVSLTSVGALVRIF
jgi:hypothetical protein